MSQSGRVGLYGTNLNINDLLTLIEGGARTCDTNFIFVLKENFYYTIMCRTLLYSKIVDQILPYRLSGQPVSP